VLPQTRGVDAQEAAAQRETTIRTIGHQTNQTRGVQREAVPGEAAPRGGGGEASGNTTYN
jgi:hypothetical protein